MRTYGFLIETAGRSLFVREESDITWAKEDANYTVRRLVDADEVVIEDTSQEHSFDDYVQVSSELYNLQQAQIDLLKGQLEEFVEVVEAISEISVVSENVIENKAIIMLVNQQCKKLLAAKES